MNNSSKVLALKYRPQSFNDLIGQEEIVQTIYNAIKSNKTPNAYLFTGIRGIGKTTIARIVAKSLNCINGVDQLCKKDYCEHCKSITSSNHIDVLEMDAASKTGVDDVRDLIEFSRYGPNSAKYKIFIIDEVHMLSKQAFNALLKTLEEPPEYLKFIFATTELKKIPITILSRCQRFDLPRIRSEELFKYIKKITKLENGSAKDDALKLIVKISEGSVRDALSLLDRALVSLSNQKKEIDLESVQKIFGYFDKTLMIKMFEYLLTGDEENVLNLNKKIYDLGVDPKNFLNDFLEVLYYIKNISSLKLNGSNFSLNEEEFNAILNIAKSVEAKTLMTYWQFAIMTLEELEIVSNQNISIEMFLIRLLYLKDIKKKKLNNDIFNDYKNNSDLNKEGSNLDSNRTIKQIKNFHQEEKLNIENNINEDKLSNKIKSFNDLIRICNDYKEIKLKYELETNVNLVRFENQLIEISFNENLDKDFVKDLSEKLFNWTSKRWIITFSKKNGLPSKKQLEKDKKKNLIFETKKSETYKKIIEMFSGSELIDVIKFEKND